MRPCKPSLLTALVAGGLLLIPSQGYSQPEYHWWGRSDTSFDIPNGFPAPRRFSPPPVYYPPVVLQLPAAPPAARAYYYSPEGVARAPENAALVTVRVPTADAQVWFNNAATRRTGTERQFVSPQLAAGPNYSYEVRALWRANGRTVEQTRTVRVNPGQAVTVDFTATQ
jgi:uncharacterized protein (TIGR03000 family)